MTGSARSTTLRRMATRRATRLACTLAASLAISCSEPNPADPTAEQTRREIDLGGRLLVVEDAGQTPRRRLSYAGAHDRRVRMRVSFRQPPGQGKPGLHTILVLVLDWQSRGPAIHDFAMRSVERPSDQTKIAPTPPELAEALEQVDAAFLRVRGSIRVEEGRPLQISANRDEVRLVPDISTILDLFLVPLPDAEVGVGARWVTLDVTSKERREYVLTGLDETSATLDFERTSLEGSRLPLPGIRGKFELEFSDPLPTRGELELELRAQHLGQAGDQTVETYQIFELDTPP